MNVLYEKKGVLANQCRTRYDLVLQYLFIQYSLTRRSFAEREGFEPSIPLRVYYLSRVANSTTLAPLQVLF